MEDLHAYVGRIVRLKEKAFLALKERARRQGVAIENCFVVAAVSGRLHKLICYGANFRVTVGAGEVILV